MRKGVAPMPTNSPCSLCCVRRSVLVALALLTLAAALPAQTNPPSTPSAAAPQLSFDVVSVRPNKSGSTAMTRQSSADTDDITMTNVPLGAVVFYAYYINNENLV